MPTAYRAPLSEMKFALSVLDCASEMDEAILSEAAKFAETVLSPLNAPNDRQGAQFDAQSHQVTTANGMAAAYQAFCQNGWNGASCAPEFGGMGLSAVHSALVGEMWHASHMSFGLCPMLTQSAVELLMAVGSDAQKQVYLPKMISGEWTGTMCMTEPAAGSDIGEVAARAIAAGEHYRVSGTKIFITYGEHDLTENIIHIVLARLDGAPEGVKGLSLFIVPKIKADGAANAVQCLSIEEKMGIHASPTCVMEFDGAEGVLLGQKHGGIQAMFVMMNAARFAVGLQGLGQLRYAYQQAKDFAAERVQGGGKTIDQHPDIRRVLLSLQGHDLTLRLMAVLFAKAVDAGDEGRVALLTPLCKAQMTRIGFEGASEALQVFGGMGYVEETGIAQLVRDSRIAMIYEGTNGIQALDLSGRKLRMNQGKAVQALLGEMWQDLNALAQNDTADDGLQAQARLGLKALDGVDKAVVYQQQCLDSGEDRLVRAAQFAAEDCLQAMAGLVQCWLGLKALTHPEASAAHRVALQFFIHRSLPEVVMTSRRVLSAHDLADFA